MNEEAKQWQADFDAFNTTFEEFFDFETNPNNDIV
jgi:hypothetical protein